MRPFLSTCANITLSPQITRRGSSVPEPPPHILHLDNWGCIDGRHRMLLTLERRLLGADQAAWAYLHRGGAFTLNDGRVQLVCRSECENFEALLHVGPDEVATMMLSAPKRQVPLLVQAAELGRSNKERMIGVSFALLEDRPMQWINFVSVFGLTATENDIVAHLLNGNPPHKIADAQKVSINTVRTHIHRIYDKIGVTHREELWCRLAPFRIR